MPTAHSGFSSSYAFVWAWLGPGLSAYRGGSRVPADSGKSSMIRVLIQTPVACATAWVKRQVIRFEYRGARERADNATRGSLRWPPLGAKRPSSLPIELT